MGSVNLHILVGRLGSDPELRQAQNSKICKFSIATTEYVRGQGEETEWHYVTVFGPRAEHCAQYLRKGSLVAVLGRGKSKKWVKDGVTQRGSEVKTFDVQFLSSVGGQSKPTEKSQIPPNQGFDSPFGATGSLDDVPF
jgi:single-strand DNA-binding protein